jgi:quercetin 2,3-dioxygenase
MKKIVTVLRGGELHWVGDAFPVRSIFTYDTLGSDISPFLLLDYTGTAEFPASDQPRGVGMHPHRGFETVTIVYQGELEHRDSAGNHGSIGPGDVQWMTAASGILHEEKHSREFSKRGGALEMAQLWVNLPAQFKMAPPRYQTLLDQDIPAVTLAGDAGKLRVIAGIFEGTKGPAHTFTPVNLWDLRLQAGQCVELDLADGYTTALVILKGNVTLNELETASAAELALFDRSGDQIIVDASADSTVLLLNGAPIDEPIVGYGPFVMNTKEEIDQALTDLRQGKLVR